MFRSFEIENFYQPFYLSDFRQFCGKMQIVPQAYFCILVPKETVKHEFPSICCALCKLAEVFS